MLVKFTLFMNIMKVKTVWIQGTVRYAHRLKNTHDIPPFRSTSLRSLPPRKSMRLENLASLTIIHISINVRDARASRISGEWAKVTRCASIVVTKRTGRTVRLSRNSGESLTLWVSRSDICYTIREIHASGIIVTHRDCAMPKKYIKIYW